MQGRRLAAEFLRVSKARRLSKDKEKLKEPAETGSFRELWFGLIFRNVSC